MLAQPTLFRRRLYCRFIKLRPYLSKLSDKRLDQSGVRCDDQVFLVSDDGLHGPVEGSGNEDPVVNDGELVVHQVTVVVTGRSS